MDELPQASEEPSLKDAVGSLISELPAPLQRFIKSPERDALVLTLTQKYGLHADQAGAFELAFLHMLLGVSSPAEFSESLKESGIPGNTIQLLVNDINELVFKKIRNEEIMGEPTAPISRPQTNPVPQTPQLSSVVAHTPELVPQPAPTTVSVPPVVAPASVPVPKPVVPAVPPAVRTYPQPVSPMTPSYLRPQITTPTLRPLTPFPPFQSATSAVVPPALPMTTTSPLATVASHPTPPVIPTATPVVAHQTSTPTVAPITPTEARVAPVLAAAPAGTQTPPLQTPVTNTFTPISAPSIPSNTQGHKPTLEGATIRTMQKDMQATHDHKPAEPLPYHLESVAPEVTVVSAPVFSPRQAPSETPPWPLQKPVAEMPTQRQAPPPTNLPGTPVHALIKEYGNDPYRESV